MPADGVAFEPADPRLLAGDRCSSLRHVRLGDVTLRLQCMVIPTPGGAHPPKHHTGSGPGSGIRFEWDA